MSASLTFSSAVEDRSSQEEHLWAFEDCQGEMTRLDDPLSVIWAERYSPKTAFKENECGVVDSATEEYGHLSKSVLVCISHCITG